nr:serine hydrolase-like protein [Nerophis lumbriciformis]
MSQAKELRLQHDGRSIAGLVWGDDNLPKMLALHGWQDNAGSFSRLAPLLAKQHHIVAIDLTGHGQSSRLPAGAWYHHVDYLTEVLAVVEQLGWSRLDLVGHSMGGALAALWAAALPERVERLICIDSLGSVTDSLDNTVGRLRKALTERQQWQDGTRGRVYSDRAAAVAARCRSGALSQMGASDLAERGLEQLTDGYHWSVDRRQRVSSITQFTEQQIQKVLSACVKPTLVIHARDSAFKLPAEIFKARLAAMPATTKIELAGGHHLHIERAVAVAECIEDFLQTHPLASAPERPEG